ncbi:MAG: hypothetical protein IJQ99_02340 [Synergistaceae bacterium]|nr:hypothetical protein [Synergistaceae bacterium]
MAIGESVVSEKVYLELNNGDVAGITQTVSLDIGDLGRGSFDAQKAWNIALVLSDFITKELYGIRHVQEKRMFEDD